MGQASSAVMRVIAMWPDPRDPSRIVDQSRECGPGPFRDEYFMTPGHGMARGAVDISQVGPLNVSNARNATEAPRASFNGRRRA